MPTSLNNQSMNNNARFRNNEQYEEDDAMTMESLSNSDFVLTNVPPMSSFPFPTTASDYIDGANPYYNMIIADIMNEMRTEQSRDFERYFEEVVANSFPRVPSPFSLPLPILGETPHQLPRSPSRENETDDFLERANQILSNNSNDFGLPYANHPSNEETRTIERARRVAAPIMFPEEDEEPLLLYNEDKPNQHYTGDDNLNNAKEEEEIEGVLMVNREPFTVNHAEYIPSNDPEYKPQQFDEEMEEPTTFQAMHNISLLPDNNDPDEINNDNNWLCFDTEMELEEFKKSFKEYQDRDPSISKLNFSNIISNTIEKEIDQCIRMVTNNIEQEDMILSRDKNNNNNKPSLKREYSNKNQLSYSDGGFSYTKRVKPSSRILFM